MKWLSSVLIWLSLAVVALADIDAASLGFQPGYDTPEVVAANDKAWRETFAGSVAPKDRVHFASGNYYFTMPLTVAVGCDIEGCGGPGYERPEGTAPVTTATRFYATNPESHADFIHVCCADFKISGIQLSGRRWSDGSKWPEGPSARALIAFDGKNQPPTGRHAIRDVGLYEADYGIICLATPEETHADLSFVENVVCDHLRCFFRSENSQAVGWDFVHIVCFEGATPFTALDFQRGGKSMVNGLKLHGNHITAVRIGDDLAPNCNRCDIYGFLWDHNKSDPNDYLKLLDSPNGNFQLLINGHMNNPQFAFDRSKLGLSNPGLKPEITNLPKQR